MTITGPDIDAAYLAYLQAAQDQVDAARRASAPPCLLPWSGDLPGPSYVGTRCGRHEGHLELGQLHGLRVGGVLLEWH